MIKSDRIRELLLQGLSLRKVQAVMEKEGTPTSLGNISKVKKAMLGKGIVVEGKPKKDGETFERTGGKGGREQSLKFIGSRVRTVEDALEKAEIDVRLWDVERFKVNSWEVASKDPSGKVTTTPLWQVCVWLRRKAEDILQLEVVAERTIEQMKVYAPKTFKILERAPMKATGRMLELDLFDVHLGLLSWAAETGVNYDTEIAESRYMRLLKQLLVVAGPGAAEVALLVAGNDFLQVDTERATTTQETAVDVDTRATRVFERGKWLMVSAIDLLLQQVGRVVVPIVPGNHDRFSMLHLGHVLAAWYRHAGGKVQIDFSPKLRKYVEWGQCLLGFTHGSEEKKERLPMIMAHEQKQAWARTKYRTWRIGHKHSPRALLLKVGDTLDGVWVKQCAALTSRDAWTTKKGLGAMGSAPGASATVWDKELGSIAEYTLSV